MNIPILLETAISLFALLTIMSILTSSVLELLESWVRRRSKYLKKAIDKALTDPSLSCCYATLFYEHPQIKTLQQSDKKYPSYIDSEVFSQVLVDIVIKQYEKENLVFNQETKEYELPKAIKKQNKEKRLNGALNSIQNSEMGILLNSFRNSSVKIEPLQEKITEWYNAYMERLGGWFKRSTQLLLLVAGFLLALGLNFDLIKITQDIYNKSEVREKIVLYAEGMKEPTDTVSDDQEVINKKIQENLSALDSFGLTLGWSHVKCESLTFLICLRMLCGWLLTGLAVTRGSAFWFGAMNKLISLRSAGTRSEPPKEKKEEKSN